MMQGETILPPEWVSKSFIERPRARQFLWRSTDRSAASERQNKKFGARGGEDFCTQHSLQRTSSKNSGALSDPGAFDARPLSMGSPRSREASTHTHAQTMTEARGIVKRPHDSTFPKHRFC